MRHASASALGACPLPHGPAVASVLLDLVLDDVGHLRDPLECLRGGRRRSRYAVGRGVAWTCRPSDAAAGPVDDVSVGRHHQHVALAVEHASWPDGLTVGADVGDLLAYQGA